MHGLITHFALHQNNKANAHNNISKTARELSAPYLVYALLKLFSCQGLWLPILPFFHTFTGCFFVLFVAVLFNDIIVWWLFWWLFHK